MALARVNSLNCARQIDEHFSPRCVSPPQILRREGPRQNRKKIPPSPLSPVRSPSPHSSPHGLSLPVTKHHKSAQSYPGTAALLIRRRTDHPPRPSRWVVGTSFSSSSPPSSVPPSSLLYLPFSRPQSISHIVCTSYPENYPYLSKLHYKWCPPPIHLDTPV